MVGVIGIIAAEMLKSSVTGAGAVTEGAPVTSTAVRKAAQSGSAAVLYLLALGALYKFTNKFTPLLLVTVGAISGQFIFVD